MKQNRLLVGIFFGLHASSSAFAEATPTRSFDVLNACITAAAEMRYLGYALYNREFGPNYRLSSDLLDGLEERTQTLLKENVPEISNYFADNSVNWVRVIEDARGCIDAKTCYPSVWGADMERVGKGLLEVCASTSLGG